MFRISSETLDPNALRHALEKDSGAGACVVFEGWVRNRNEGRAVRTLEYEAYAPLASSEGDRILAEARARYEILGASGAHRTGTLAIGDMAVWVGVTAGHRDAAFAACRFIIDEAKARLPIWKKEHYSDGASVWINGAVRGEFAGGHPPVGRPATAGPLA